MFAHDRRLGSPLVAGADEAGRGCLAGPLVAAGVLFDLEGMTLSQRRSLSGLDDSKRLSREERERLRAAISEAAIEVSVIVVDVTEIDRNGVHACNLEALSRALDGLAGACDGASPACLVDGYDLEDCGMAHDSLIGGDGRSAAVAAASVVAKASRDGLMREAEDRHPGWGFAEHVGYGTPDHLEALRRIGPSPLHRRSFNCSAYPETG